MKSIVAILLLASLASAVTMSDFHAWASKNGKSYTKAQALRRFSVFRANVARVEAMNKASKSATFTLNKFADLTHEEFAATYTTDLLVTDKRTPIANPDLSAADVTDGADYRSWLPAVKDQAQCGSCWAFSATANMEGQVFKNTKNVVSISEQQLVSCSKFPNMACNGGNTLFADIYAVKHGMTSEAQYPYTSSTGTVAECKNFTVEYNFTNAHQWLALKDSSIIERLTQYGPLSVAIEADKECFQHYASGVLDHDDCKCGYMVNHGVTLVGYGTDETSQLPYWLVRNSWGSTWGDNGYVKLVRGKDMCNINQRPSSIEY